MFKPNSIGKQKFLIGPSVDDEGEDKRLVGEGCKELVYVEGEARVGEGGGIGNVV